MGFNYDTWGGSWGTSWGNSWGTTVSTPVQPEVGSSISGGSFSRRRWRELREAQEALLKAEQAALDLKKQKQHDDAIRAIKLAEEAIALAEAAEAEADLQRRISQLTKACQAAAGAKQAAGVMAAMKRIELHAMAIIRAEEEDDETAIELILLS